jgi:ubiquinone/menaquinone biosynthesis C-methylase UbiE/glutathione S-transferase
MSTPARLRLYQYAGSPYCIPVELALRHSGIPYEVVNLPVGDPKAVIELTQGACYHVPVLEDLFNRTLVWDKTHEENDVARYLSDLAPLMNLFPVETAGWQAILLRYIEDHCEAFSFKVCDAFRDKWLRNDLERGLHRRHKERKFGVGCLEEWTREANTLIAGFHQAIQPFESILARQPCLTGSKPVFADYALCGVIGNFLFSKTTSLPANCLMLEAWYTRMCAGNFRGALDDLQLNAQDDDAATTRALVADVADMEKTVLDLKLRPGSAALDVGTGRGHTALALAARGFQVTACDTSGPHLQEAARLAAERKLPITFHEQGPAPLPYADNSFGLITCRMAAHHFSAPEAFVREATRVLKTYGYLVLIDGTIPDDQVEAQEWMNALERLRDPGHVRFITPNTWRKWCVDAGLTVTRVQVEAFAQPDLNTYFAETDTPPENRRKILELLAKAPASVRELFKIGQQEGRIVWQGRRVTVVAGKI